jgi:arsenite transporter
MTATPLAAGSALPAAPAIGRFERYLSVWVALCIGAGILLGQGAPDLIRAVGSLEVARVNLPVGALVWVMIVPMLLKIDFAALGQVRSHARGIGVTLFVNWAVKPFSMALLGWLFIRHVFAPWLPPEQLDGYVAGLILLAAAPCTAMVFVWSQLCRGDPYFTLSQVALNDAIMVVAFAPIVALLLGLSSITVPWDTLLASVGLYIVVPVIIAQAWRKALRARAPGSCRPWSSGSAPSPLPPCCSRWCCCSPSRANASSSNRWSSPCWRCRS